MKFSELADAYDRISGAGSDPARVKILAKIFDASDDATLQAAAHFSLRKIS
jgi:hypothetical protein